MNDKNIKYREKEKLKFKTNEDSSLDSKSTGNLCPSCSHENDRAALFCEECGSSLKPPIFCPNCNSVARPFADICEECQKWLLKGQCMFCYAQIEEGQKFCGECGSSASGIECPQCGEVSIFDFCKNCRIPLSNQAKDAMQETTGSEIFQEMSALVEEIVSIPNVVNVTEPAKGKQTTNTKEYDDYLKLKAYRESLDKPSLKQNDKKQEKPFFSQSHKDQINKLYLEVKEEEERLERARQDEQRKRKEAEEKKRQLLEELNKVMKKFENKTFSTQQEARRFYMSILAQFPAEVVADKGLSIGWRCNAYGVLHLGPTDCGGPGAGGVWVFE